MFKVYLIAFIIFIILCQYLLYHLRKKLPPREKRFVVETSGNIDLITLSVLLIGYLFLAFFTSKLTLYIYFVTATALCILLSLYFYRRLRSKELEKMYCFYEAFIFFIISFATLIFGILLLISFD